MLKADAIQKLDDAIINLHGLRVEVEILDTFTIFEIVNTTIDYLYFIQRQNSKDLKNYFECISIGDDISHNGRR